MCAESKAKLKDQDVDVYMGYYGGSISIGEFKYFVGLTEHKRSRDELIAKLTGYTQSELAGLIADLIENAEEG